MKKLFTLAFLSFLTLTEAFSFSKTIFLNEAGTLSNYISDSEKYEITDLYVSGLINGTDLRLIRDMAGGRMDFESHYYGKLSQLDLSDAIFLAGGAEYINGCRVANSTDLPEYAFYNCELLKKVYLPTVTKNICVSAFEGCLNLEWVSIPCGVEKMECKAFNSCHLTTIYLPSTLISIYWENYSRSIFFNDRELTSIYCRASNPPVCKTDFDSETSNHATVYVPKGSINKYWNAQYWGRLNSIKEEANRWFALTIKTSMNGYIYFSNKRLIKRFADIDVDGIHSFDVKEGSDVQLSIMPDEGYRIGKVLLNNEDVTGQVTNNILIISNVTSVNNLNVTFEPKPSDEADICKQPVINIVEGKLHIESATPGSSCKYVITSEDIKSGTAGKDGLIELTGQYAIRAYATAEGYQDSETAEAVLLWVNPTIESDGIMTIEAKKAVVIKVIGGQIVACGTEPGEHVALFTLNGRELVSMRATDGETALPCNLPSGEIVIVRYGDKSVKIKL